jgi:VCBS repeat-containing protein
MGPASGNAITGAGTVTGQSGADTPGAGGASVVEVHGSCGATSGGNGNFQASGQYGVLSMDAQGDFNYVRNPGTPDGVRDVFQYTLADAQGAHSATTLTIDIGQVLTANAGIVNLPAGVEMSDIHVVGRDLVIDMPDGTHMVIPNGAVFVPQLSIGDVAVPASNVAALLIDAEPQPAAGNTPSSGGNFADPVPPLDPGVPLGDLIPPTELTYHPPEFQPEGQFIDREPTIEIQPDGQPASLAAIDDVNEKGLPTRNGGEPAGSGEIADGNGSNNSDTTETTGGTIIIDSPDGVGSVMINGVLVTGTAGQQIAGEFGTLTITGFSGANILYTYTLADNTSGDNTHDDFSVTVTDDDGDQATATLTIDIIDDVPTARDDTDSVDSNQVATGNVITAVGTTNSGADTVGADDAHITAVSGAGGSDSTFENGALVVAGAHGTLELHADGSYTYTRTPGDIAGGTDVFTYTLTDGDGDSDTATLTITLPNINRPPIVAAGDSHVSEEGLAGGNPDDNGSPDTTNSATASGDVIVSDPDGDATTATLGIPSGSFTSGGTAITWALSNGGHTLTGSAGSQTIITVTIQDNGQYTVNLTGPIDDANTSIEDAISFTVPVTVSDGTATVSTSIAVTVEDDSPIANDDTGHAVEGTTLVVTTSVLDNDQFGGDGPLGGTQSVTSVTHDGTTVASSGGGDMVIAGTYGTLTMHADGTYTYLATQGSIPPEGATETFTYLITDGDHDTDTATLTINVDNNNLTPLAGTVDAFVDDEGLAGGIVGGSGDIDANSGEVGSGTSSEAVWTGTLQGSGGDAPLNFAFSSSLNGTSVMVGTESATYSVSGDGLTLTATGPRGVIFTVHIDNAATGAYTLTLNDNVLNTFGDNTEASATVNIPYTVNDVDSSVTGTIHATFNDDTPTATNDSSNAVEGTTLIVNTSVLSNDAFGADGPLGGTASVSSVTHGGTTVSNSGGDMVIAGTYGTLTMHSNGTYTYLANDGSIPPAGATETFSYLITDGDGDTATATLTITVANNNLTPIAGTVNAFVDDEGLAGGIAGNGQSSGDINANAGEVGAGTSSEAVWTGTLQGSGGDAPLNFAFSSSLNGTTVAVGTETATYSVSGDGLTLTATGPRGVIFTVHIDNAATGAYTLTLVDNVLNTFGDNTEASATVNIPYTVNDVDSSVTGTIHATFNDDTPTATNDSSNAVEGTTLIVNTSVLSNDAFGADGPLGGTASVSSVTHGGTTVSNSGGDMVIAGTYGTLTMHSNGTYTYLATQGSIPPAGATETFSYKITDGDGDTATATLTITVADNNLTPTAGTVNAFVDDEGLAGGNLGGTGDIDANAGEVGAGTSSEAVWTGTLQGSGGDAPISFLFAAALNGTSVTVGTESATYSVSGDGLTLTATGPRGVIFTVHIDNAATGAYTLTLNDNVLNTYGDNTEASAIVNIPYTVKDVDGSTAAGTIHATFNDDTPTLGTIQPITTDNNPTDTNSTIHDGQGSLHLSIGADGFKSVVISPDLTGITSGGHALLGSQTGNVYTAYADVDGSGTINTGDTAVFTITVDPNGGTTGTYTFDLLQPLDGTTVDTPIGGSSSFGAGPTGFQVLQNTAGTQDLSVLTGYHTTASFNEATWLSTGNLTSAMITDAGVNGSTAGWGVDNNNFNGTDELMFFDFGSQALSDPDGAGGIDPNSSGASLPNISFATFDFIQYTTADDIKYVVHFTDGTFTSGTIPAANMDASGPNWTFTAPSGKFIADIELFTSGTGSGKVDLVSVGVQSSNHDNTIPVDMTFTDNDGDTVTGSTTIHVVDGGTATTPNAVVNTLMALNTTSTDTSSLVSTNDNHRSFEEHRAGNNAALLGAIAAAGLGAAEQAAASTFHGSLHGSHSDPIVTQQTLPDTQFTVQDSGADPASVQPTQVVADTQLASASHLSSGSDAANAHGFAGHQAAAHEAVTQLLAGTEGHGANHGAAAVTAASIAIPPAQLLAAHVGAGNGGVGGAENAATGVQSNAVVSQVLADALAGGHGHGPNIDTLLHNAVGHGHGNAQDALAALASHDTAGVSFGHSGVFAGFHNAPIMEQMMMHQDAAPVHN